MTSPTPSVRLATDSDIDALKASISGAHRIAIDTEFHAERRFLPELFLVQIKVDTADAPIWILDPLQSNVLSKLAGALRSVPWVLHSGEQDLRILHHALGGLPETVLDTQIAAGLVTSHWPAPYAGLVHRWLGASLEKGETLSDWSRRPLTEAQLAYAALDVDLLIPLWESLEAELARRGRRDLAHRACAAALTSAREPDEFESIREIAAASSLQPEVLVVLQELSAWRIERARATNQPVRAVLADGALVDLARRRPMTVDALLANRRLPRSLIKEATDLVERISRAASRPLWATPKIARKRTPEWRSAAWLQLLAEVIGERESFGASLALSRAMAERIAIDPPATRQDLASLLGWRDDLLGDSLYRALGGEISLAITSPKIQRLPRSTAPLDVAEMTLAPDKP